MQGDDLPTTIHLGAYDNNLHVGVATFLKSNAQESPVADQDASFYQLRGMGVLATHQGNGIGKQLLTHGLKVLKNKNIDLVWCNARIAAISFYERANFLKYGEPFEVEHIGKHYKMVKRL
jgi:ribosomal protein S18 acetylase RimI-like enzyme